VQADPAFGLFVFEQLKMTAPSMSDTEKATAACAKLMALLDDESAWSQVSDVVTSYYLKATAELKGSEDGLTADNAPAPTGLLMTACEDLAEALDGVSGQNTDGAARLCGAFLASHIGSLMCTPESEKQCGKVVALEDPTCGKMAKGWKRYQFIEDPCEKRLNGAGDEWVPFTDFEGIKIDKRLSKAEQEKLLVNNLVPLADKLVKYKEVGIPHAVDFFAPAIEGGTGQSEVAIEGVLAKKMDIKGWKTRQVKLFKDGRLSWSEGDQEKGSMMLTTTTVVRIMPAEGGSVLSSEKSYGVVLQITAVERAGQGGKVSQADKTLKVACSQTDSLKNPGACDIKEWKKNVEKFTTPLTCPGSPTAHGEAGDKARDALVASTAVAVQEALAGLGSTDTTLAIDWIRGKEGTDPPLIDVLLKVSRAIQAQCSVAVAAVEGKLHPCSIEYEPTALASDLGARLGATPRSMQTMTGTA